MKNLLYAVLFTIAACGIFTSLQPTPPPPLIRDYTIPVITWPGYFNRTTIESQNKKEFTMFNKVEKDEDVEMICPVCGEVVLEVPKNYMQEWPNSCSAWLDDQEAKHLEECKERDY